jgi:SnoaL-like protein
MDLEELVAQQEIRDVLIRYTRGIDRMDLELVRSCYWPGAYDDHAAYQGPVEGFYDWVQQALSYFDSTMHFIGNQLVEVRGDAAHAESYCVAYHRRGARDGEEGHDLITGLRYVDRLERRPAGDDGEWRIEQRRCVFDWTRRDPIVGEWELPPEARRGRRDRADTVYQDTTPHKP